MSEKSEKPGEPRKKRTADEMAGMQREISVSEFFVKNRHLLGFDNPLKALMTTVKEGVDNALDACEEAGILPEISVEITRAADLPPAPADGSLVSSADPAAVAASTAALAASKPAEAQTTAATAASDGTAKRSEDPLFQRTLFDAEGAMHAGPAFDPSVRRGRKKFEEEAAAAAARAAAAAAGAPAPAADTAAASATSAESDEPGEKKRGRKITDPPERFVVAIEDNGPGIVAEQVGKIFGKLLYGSKFHRLRQARGQQGIGISAAGMYGQLTTGKPVRIISRTGKKKLAHAMDVSLDLQRNQPEVRNEREGEWAREHGTRVEIELEAKHQKGRSSVYTWLRATALANPHATFRYRDPDGVWHTWERTTRSLPVEAKEIKPHPKGVELGMLLQMLKSTEHKKLGAFLSNDFCRISTKTAEEICNAAGLNPQTWIARVAREEATKLHAALGAADVMNPPTDCVSPIGEGLLVDSVQREYPQAFIRAVTRSPKVYRGNPFQVEVALAHAPEALPAEEPITLLRFANRVPLLYQQGACAVQKAVVSVPWKSYLVQQSKGSLPVGPIVLMVHVASAWVPFTSESKEAIASYEEIIDEIRLAVMECGRSLGNHLAKVRRDADERKSREYIALYIPKISEALQKILEFDKSECERTTARLTDILNRSRGQ